MIIFNDRRSIDRLKDAYVMNGGVWEKGNLGGILNFDAKPDRWGDALFYATDKMIMIGKGTCRPGKPATEKKKGGAEHLAPGYYKNLWDKAEYGRKFGMEVFKQHGKIDGFLDANRNYIHDPSDPLFNDVGPEAGCWMHSTTKRDLRRIGNTSWLCQAWEAIDDFTKVTKASKESDQLFFSYMLFVLKEEVQFLYDAVYGEE